jgi:hypothetical protein
MSRRVDARDVLDPNARAKCAFRGWVVGFFRRVGPDKWDDYEYVVEPGGDVDVLPGIAIQIERHGAEFRMRRRGQVVRVAWSPAEELDRALGKNQLARRARFLQDCVDGFAEGAGQGAGAAIVRKLRG